MNRNVVIGVIVVAVIAVVGYRVGAAGGGDAALEPIALDGADDPAQLVEMTRGITLGDSTAPITIVEFGDYQCPACMGFNQTVKPQIDISLIQSGEGQFIYYDFPLMNAHPWAFIAARAAHCADDQGMFWAYHDEIYANQPEWSPSALPPLGEFEDYAETVGLDGGTFSDCLRSDRHAAAVTANLELARQLGVGGTPTVMVSIEGGPARQIANNSFGAIQEAIEELRAGVAGGNGGDR